MKAIEVQELRKEFDGVKAVDGLSFTVSEGTITSLIGPNGAGKTTTFDLLCGLLRPDSGRVFVGGRETTRLAPHRVARAGLGRTFQNIRVFPQITVMENLMLASRTPIGESIWGAIGQTGGVKVEESQAEEQALEYLDFVGLMQKKNELAEALSYGQRKLLELARALATGTRILLLDEPTAGVYPETKTRILELLRELRRNGTTVLFIEHDMKTVMRISDVVIVMNYGRKLTEGTPSEVQENEEVIEAYLGRDNGFA